MKSLQAGDLDRVIHLTPPLRESSPYGGPGTQRKFNEELMVPLFANRRDVEAGSSEGSEGRVTAATSFTVFTVRYRSDIRPDWRLICEGVRYDIERVSESERGSRRQWLEIRAKRID